MNYEWDPRKAAANFKKHAVRLPEAIPVFEDEYAVTIDDDESEPAERRFISIGTGLKGRVLVIVYTWRGSGTIRLISARRATRQERLQYEEGR